jgi:hypothetical protein
MPPASLFTHDEHQGEARVSVTCRRKEKKKGIIPDVFMKTRGRRYFLEWRLRSGPRLVVFLLKSSSPPPSPADRKKEEKKDGTNVDNINADM